MSDPNVALTLQEAVQEVLGHLTGLDLNVVPEEDRFYAITRQLNRALRYNALEHEWSYYSEVVSLGTSAEDQQTAAVTTNRRIRKINDDAVRLVDENGVPWRWAYILPRDALHKYAHRVQLRCSVTTETVTFSRPLWASEAGYELEVAVMREPVMFVLPDRPTDAATAVTPVPALTLDTEVDFDFPDLIVMRAAYLYGMTDPVMQPRAQTLEAQYKDLMYQLMERDDQHTDTPYQNDFHVPVQNGIYYDSVFDVFPQADARIR